MGYEPFTIRIIPFGNDRYETHVECAVGKAEAPCDLSELSLWLEMAAEAIPAGDGRWRSGDFDNAQQALDAARLADSQWGAQRMGSDLFRAVFRGEILRLFYESLGQARSGRGVLPVELRFELEDPLQARLATLPWEQLYDPDRGHFLAQKEETPVVRYLSFDGRAKRFELPPVLRVLVVTASPHDLLTLDFAQELGVLWRWPQANIVVRRLDGPTRETLRRALRDVHVLHFMGHGIFDVERGEGSIGLLDTDKNVDWVSGRELASWLLNRPELRLVVLNACSTGNDMGAQPFTGVASALVRGGVPAVLAMRRPIPDGGAGKLAHELYSRLMDGRPLDAALSSARHELEAKEPKTDDWATPALFVHAADVFHVPADIRPSLTKIYSWLGVITANIAINAWSRSQQGPTLPGFGLSDIDQETVPIFGVLLVAPLLLLLLYVLLRYQRAAKDTGIFHRVPVAFDIPLMASGWLARLYQWILLLALVVMPVASQIHFMRLIYEGTTWECEPDHHDFATRLEHFTKPAPFSVLWDHKYCFGPKKKDGVRSEGCDDVAVCEVTFFPFWQPWLYVLGEFLVLMLFISVMWGIWASKPLRWRTLLMKPRLWAACGVIAIVTMIASQTGALPSLEQARAEHRERLARELGNHTLLPASDASLFVGVEAIDQMFDALEGVEVSPPQLAGVRLRIMAVETRFENGFAGLEAKVEIAAGAGSESVQRASFKVGGYVEIAKPADDFELQLRLVEVDQIREGGAAAEPLLTSIVRSALSELGAQLPAPRVARRQELPIRFTGEPLATKIETADGSIQGNLQLPPIDTVAVLHVVKILALKDGLYVALRLDVPNAADTAPAWGSEDLPSGRSAVKARLSGAFFEKVLGLIGKLPPAARVIHFQSTKRRGQLISDNAGPCHYFVELDKDGALRAKAKVRQVEGAWREGSLRARLPVDATAEARLHWHVDCGLGGGLGDRVDVDPSASESLELVLAFDSGTVVPRYKLTVAAPRKVRLKENIKIENIAEVPIELPLPLPEQLAEGELPTIRHRGVLDLGSGQRRDYELSLKPSRAVTGPKGIEIHFHFERTLAEVRP